MSSLLDDLFGATGFMPYGYSLSWRPDLVALHGLSDLAIAAAYFAIPLAILVLWRRRRELGWEARLVAILFGAFIVACGLTHIGGLLTLWWPLDGFHGLVKAGTALVSIATAVVFWQLIPKLAAIPSPAAAEAMNRRLLAEAAAREEAVAALERGRMDLERIVAERTEELRRVTMLFEAATNGANITMTAQDRDLRYTWIHNPRLGIDADAVVGRLDADILPPGPRETIARHKRRTLETGTPETFEVEMPEGGDAVWFHVDVSPLRAADGSIEGVVSTAIDITRAKQLEIARAGLSSELNRALQRFQVALRSGNIIVFSQDLDLRYLWVNAEDPQLGPLVGRTDDELFEEADRARIVALKRAALETATARTGEVSVTAGGTTRWYELHVEPDRCGAWGEPVGVTCAAVDVTERKRHERQLRLLMRELTHRSKNLLAVVQAIARQSVRQAQSLSAFERTFTARLRALAATQDLLVAEDWSSAGLADLVRDQVGHYLGGKDCRVALDGPEVALSPEAAQSLGLAFHELATNASKYGALSNETGRVEVSWRLDEMDGRPVLDLTWRERGGPPVAAPDRRGFGSVVIERNVARMLDAAVDLAFDPEGLVARFAVPLAMLSRAADEADEADESAQPRPFRRAS